MEIKTYGIVKYQLSFINSAFFLKKPVSQGEVGNSCKILFGLLIPKISFGKVSLKKSEIWPALQSCTYAAFLSIG